MTGGHDFGAMDLGGGEPVREVVDVPLAAVRVEVGPITELNRADLAAVRNLLRAPDGWRNVRWSYGEAAPAHQADPTRNHIEALEGQVRRLTAERDALRAEVQNKADFAAAETRRADRNENGRRVAQLEVAELKERLAASGVEARRELMAQGWRPPASGADDTPTEPAPLTLRDVASAIG